MIVYPPSATMLDPWIELAFQLHKNSAASAISSGVKSLFNGTIGTAICITISLWPGTWSTMGVSTRPGRMALTLILCGE
jgi:hypothetical protein